MEPENKSYSNFDSNLNHPIDEWNMKFKNINTYDVLYCVEGLVIAAQSTATFSRSIELPRI